MTLQNIKRHKPLGSGGASPTPSVMPTRPQKLTLFAYTSRDPSRSSIFVKNGKGVSLVTPLVIRFCRKRKRGFDGHPWLSKEWPSKPLPLPNALRITKIKPGDLKNMARRRAIKRKILLPDPIYQNPLIEMITNHLMRKGKKLLAYRICYSSMKDVGEITQKDPVAVVEQAIRNVTPLVEVKAKRRGGATYQVPVPVPPERGTALAIRWIISSCRGRSGRTMASKLTNEFLDASKNMGNAIRKKDEINRMAEANKAFATSRF